MLIEIKVKVSRVIDAKVKKRVETYLTEKELFSQAEYQITDLLTKDSTADDFEIQSLRISPIKEVADQYQGEYAFVTTLKDIWTDDDGTEKYLKYKVLLWADSLTEANQHAQQLAREGYDMLIESIKQVDYVYLNEN